MQPEEWLAAQCIFPVKTYSSAVSRCCVLKDSDREVKKENSLLILVPAADLALCPSI